MIANLKSTSLELGADMTFEHLIFRLTHVTSGIVEWYFRNQESDWVCPCCGKKLVPGSARRFETMDEHVGDPNKEEYPLRPTWVCATVGCKVNTSKSFYADGGELYTGGEGFMLNIPHTALFSWSWTYEQSKEFWQSRIGKILSFPANKIFLPFCWMGIHFPHERAWEEAKPFCTLCPADLSLAYKNKRHPFLRKYMDWQDEHKLSFLRRFLRRMV